MHRKLRRRRRDDGAVAIVVALTVTVILVLAAMVLDFGLVRVDRQVDKSAADSAVAAGLHGITNGGSKAHPYVGVCTALRYLKENGDRFSGLPESPPSPNGWTNGLGAPVGDGCTDATLTDTECDPNDHSTWAKYTWSGDVDGAPLRVTIQSGYLLTGSTGWSEDGLDTSVADTGDPDQKGCDQLAVSIAQTREPGLGSLADSSDLYSSVRSVGRVASAPGGYAPAMLLLQQTGCSVLTVANGNTKVYVAGAAASNGLTQPGTIHSDSNASGCGNNTWVYEGKQTDDIVAFAAPLATNPSQADPTKPGQISLNGGVSGSHALDDPLNVCGSVMVYASPVPNGACTSTNTLKQADRVYRKAVDTRYLSAVQSIRDAAESEFTAAAGYSKKISGAGCNNPPAALTTALTAADKLYVNCSSFGPAGNVTINAGTVVFGGTIVNPASLSMPNATKVYVAGDNTVAQNKVGISLANNTAFSMHTSGNLTSGQCSSAATGPETSSLGTNKAVLVIKNGVINMSAGQFRACYTTVVMLSGKGNSSGPNTDACMPGSPSTSAPKSNPCTGSAYTPGTGQISQTGGSVDWTAPNQHALMVNADGSVNTNFKSAWEDANGPEDLAFWSESANGNPAYRLTGGGNIHLVGVFMIPNASPLTLAGQFSQTLVNAQFVAGSIALTGGSSITMQVDPASAVTIPRLAVVGLVR